MWSKIVCVLVIAIGALADDALLSALYGVRGGNRAAVCVRRGGAGGGGGTGGARRRCDAALLTNYWLLARAYCLSTAPTERMLVVRLSTGDTCDQDAKGFTLQNPRNVRGLAMHPWFDLALVIVDWPYKDLDTLANATSARQQLKRHGVFNWMKYYFDTYALAQDTTYQMKLISKKMLAYNYPFWIFFTTILMPSVLFILFFIYITFYTGSSDKVPYKNMHYSKKVSQI